MIWENMWKNQGVVPGQSPQELTQKRQQLEEQLLARQPAEKRREAPGQAIGTPQLVIFATLMYLRIGKNQKKNDNTNPIWGFEKHVKRKTLVF